MVAEVRELGQFRMRLVGRRRKAVGPKRDFAGNAGQFGALLQPVADAGRTDHEIEGEMSAISVDLDRAAVPREGAPLAIAVDSQARLRTGAVEGVARRRLVRQIEMAADVPSRAVVELAVMRKESRPFEPAMRIHNQQAHSTDTEID